MIIALINVSGRLSTEGSRLISALLVRAGHSVKSVFLARKIPLLYEQKEIERLHEILRGVDLVMIAVYSLFAVRAVQITRFIHKNYPGMKVIWGGPHCISAPELSLRYADAVCFAEGDQVIVDFVNKIEGGIDHTDTPNMAFNINGENYINNVLPPFSDLDSLPFPDYDLDNQFLLDQELYQMTRDLFIRYSTQYPFTTPTLWILTSRGCPHRCSYCNNCRYISMHGRNPMRFRSVDNFISELEHALRTLDFFERVGFGDDDFLMRPMGQLEDFAEKYKDKIGLPFLIGASANTYKKEKMEILLDAGIEVLQIGVQSGSQRVLDEVFDRKISITKTMNTVRRIEPFYKTHGLQLILDFIIDTPYETEDDIIQTYYCLINIPQHVRINVFVLTFFPGSPIYDRALDDGYIEPFSEKTFRHYSSHNIIYQNNYATFLVVIVQTLRHLKLLQYIPRRALDVLGSTSVRGAAAIVPEPVYAFLIKIFRR
ncbi:MAG: radical SAM protein [Deltaproteobacteria bacterium]|nr:radical SAM protein [Deltaproteobacteria bacterium]